jgi:hypothetical protein
MARWIRTGRGNDAAYGRYGKNRVLSAEIATTAATINIDDRVSELSKRDIHFWTPENDARNFVLGSQPFLLKLDSSVRNSHSDNVQGVFSGEIYLVVHPRLMIGVFGDKDSNYINLISDEEMKRINGLFVKYGETIVSNRLEDLSEV